MTLCLLYVLFFVLPVELLVGFFSFPSYAFLQCRITRSIHIMPSNDFVRTVSRNFRVLVIGGSYGGLAASLALIDLSQGRIPRFDCNPDAKAPTHRIPIQITVVDKRDGYCMLSLWFSVSPTCHTSLTYLPVVHLIGSPKALACEKFASEAWTRFQDIPGLKYPGLTFIQGSVASVDFGSKVAHIVDAETKANRTEPYDYLIAGSGLRRTFPTVPQSLQRHEFLQEAKEHMSNVKHARDGIFVVGGGT
jgi:hypothetical protein